VERNKFEQGLREQVEMIIQARLGVVTREASQLQKQLSEAVAYFLSATNPSNINLSHDGIFHQLYAFVAEQVDHAQAERARIQSELEHLRSSVAEINRQRTQSDALQALVRSAAFFAPRVALFVVKGTNAVGWLAQGVDGPTSNEAIRGLSISLQADTILRAVLSSQATFIGPPDAQSDNQLIIDRLGSARPKQIAAVPLIIRNRAVAAVYTDSGNCETGLVSTGSIEILMGVAGNVIELIAMGARPAEARGKQEEEAASAAPSPSSFTQALRATPEMTQAVQQPAATPEAQPQPAPEPAKPHYEQPGPTWAPAYTQEQPEAANIESAPAASYFGSEISPGIGAPAAVQEQPQATAPGPAQENGTKSEEKLHDEARRFARLLVTEIKLYNEKKVAEGRQNRDLYDRLKEDIDRSRQMYNQRVSPTVAAKFDYFYDELVNTLGEGDPEKLGRDCPGPSVQINY